MRALRLSLAFVSTALVMSAIVLLARPVGSAQPPTRTTQAQATAQRPASNIVTCTALETHTSGQPGVTVVLFHQRDKKDQPRFASLLKQADGSTIDVKIGKADWQTVSVARLRMCFGRGLLVFAPGAIKLRDKDVFQAKFASVKPPAQQ